MSWHDELKRNGYAVVRGVFTPEHMAQCCDEADDLRRMWEADASAHTDAGLRWLVHHDDTGQRRLRAVQGAFRINPVIGALRTAPQLCEVISARLGENISTVVDSLFFKPPGEPNSGIAFHRDAEFRRPIEAFRDLSTSGYIQTGIALERHGAENGGLQVVPGSHLSGEDLGRTYSVLGVSDPGDRLDRGAGIRAISVELDPGDVVLWSAHLLHGSPANRSAGQNRRFYVVGFMRQEATDQGIPAFEGGVPVTWVQPE